MIFHSHCVVCGKQIEWREDFCSISCSSEYHHSKFIMPPFYIDNNFKLKMLEMELQNKKPLQKKITVRFKKR